MLSKLYGPQFTLEEATPLIGSKGTIAKIRAGVDPAAIAASWHVDEEKWRRMRARYLATDWNDGVARPLRSADLLAVYADPLRVTSIRQSDAWGKPRIAHWGHSAVESLAALRPVVCARRRRGGAAVTVGDAPFNVTVHEGTSMSVGVSPDGRTLAIDMQGSIWTRAVRRRCGEADHRRLQRCAAADAGRRMASGSPSSPIATAATTSGRSRRTAPNQRKLTWGAFDDREPIWSHDGTRIAFSSDRGNPLGSDYNIWTLDTAHRRAEADSPRSPPTTSCRRGRPTTRRSRSPRRATTAQAVWAVNVGRW